jgi:glycosyltransferase involved in cell wall biosynthesis
VDFHKDFEEQGLHDFFNKVSMISVPVLEGEAFGLYLLESIASGIPVVQPELGAFPEIIRKSGGGITYTPNKPESLAKALESLLADPDKLAKLSRDGRAGVEKSFDLQKQAAETIALYNEISKNYNKDSDAA